MKKLLLITDSLGLARPEPEVTYWEDTYAYMLSNNYRVYQYSVGGARIYELVKAAVFYLKQYRPDIIVIQIGLVDCAPRAYEWIEERIFEAYKWPRRLRKLISKTITTRKLRSMRRVVYTPIDKYEIYLECMHDTYPNVPLYCIGILPPSDKFEEINPGIKKNVKAYNEVLMKMFGDHYIDTSDIPAENIMSDLQHLNKEGHRWLYDRIEQYIAKCNY